MILGNETQAIECEDGIGNVETQLLLDACDPQVTLDSHSEDAGGTEVLGSDVEKSYGGLCKKQMMKMRRTCPVVLLATIARLRSYPLI